MKIYKLISFILILIIGSILIGCSNTTGNINSEKPIVAVSIMPQETFVKAVAGDLVEVVTMIPPGSSPANYQPSPMEMKKLSQASIYFTIGVPAEVDNILPKAKDLSKDMKIVNLEDGVSKIYPHRYFNEHHEHGDHEHEGHDPHIWLSPKRVKVMIQVIAEELGELDSKNKQIYEDNGEKYISKLDNLDKEIRDILDDLKNRTFIIYHPALGYFAEDYDLDMIPIESEGKKANPNDLKKIIDLAKENSIKVVFYQQEIDGSQAKALAEEIGGKTQQVEPLAPDYIENLKRMAYTFKNALQ